MSFSQKKSSTSRPSVQNWDNKAKEITRVGLSDLAGVLTRDGPDPVTIQILEEAHFLPRKVSDVAGTEHAIKSQQSLPVGFTSPPMDDSNSVSFGLNTQGFSPLKLSGVFGRPGNLPVFNLTGLHKSHILFAASNVVVYLDYYTNCQSILQGHERKISCIATSSDCIASGELEAKSTLIIWNIKTGFPIKRISATEGQELLPMCDMAFVGGGLDFIGLLHRTETVSVLKGNPETETQKMTVQNSVSIWYYGPPDKRPHRHSELHAEAQIVIPKRARSQTEIVFSPDSPYHFITTGQHQVVFYTWLRHERKIISHVPKGHLQFMRRFKEFNKSVWVKDSVLTTTSSGYIVEWKLQGPLGFEETPNPRHNVKEFRRFIKIDDEVGLTAIVAYRGFIVVGDTFGGVRFLDHKLRLLRWTTTGTLRHTIRSLAFNLTENQPVWKSEMQSTYARAGYDHDTFHRKGHSAVCDYTFGGTKYRPPSESTIERLPMHKSEECLDMVVGYDNGSIAYFHIAEEKVDLIVKKTFEDEDIAAMDASPATSQFVMSTLSGAIQLYDYKTSEVLFSQKIFKKEVQVTCVKFHPSGAFLVLGTTKGTVYFRRSFTLGLMSNPVQTGKKCITKIVFSSCGLYMGLGDDGFTVTLCNYNADLGVWAIKGKHRSHYRTIVDLAFFHDPIVGHQRFFSLGQDKRVVEYDISESTARKGLKILTESVLEQTHIPTSLIFDTPFPDHGPILLYANTNNKIRMFDQDALKIRKTCQGPKYGAPVTQMVKMSLEASVGREANFVLMVMGNKIGLMMTPIDGNPFKYMAVLGHPNDIQNVGIGSEGKVFTRADNDRSIFMWIPDFLVLETAMLNGGTGAAPFKFYLDAGVPRHLSVVEDIKFVFYHLLMKRTKTQQEVLLMNLAIPLAEIPTVMRTCGYFPSELEIDMILEEVEFLLGLKYGVKQEEIGYEDFLVLFANHRDSGVSGADVTRAFEILGMEDASNEISIDKNSFVSFITTKGETLKEKDLPLFLPNFYKDVVPVIETKKELQRLLPTATSVISLPTARSAMSVASITWDGKEGSSVVTKHDFPRHSTVSAKSDTSFERMSRASRASALNKHSVAFRGSSGDSHTGEDQWLEPKTMPNEISAKFFIQSLLPSDIDEPLNLSHSEFLDDIHDLDRISAGNQNRALMDEITEHWKCREEWRYFKQIFERLKAAEVPFDERLEALLAMDNYFTGQGSAEQEEDLEATELSDEDETTEDSDWKDPSLSLGYKIESRRQVALEKLKRVEIDEEPLTIQNESNIEETVGEEDEEDQDVYDNDDHLQVEEDAEVNNLSEDLTSNRDLSETEAGEMADGEETMEDTDNMTQGNRSSPPFTGITDSDFGGSIEALNREDEDAEEKEN